MHRTLMTLIGIAFLAAGVAAAQTRFLDAMPDVPLPPAYEETDGASVVFDKPEGRVVRTSAHGGRNAPSARAFYRETLPGLGWRRVAGEDGRDIYERGEERLALSFIDRPDGRRIDFSVTPRG